MVSREKAGSIIFTSTRQTKVRALLYLLTGCAAALGLLSGCSSSPAPDYSCLPVDTDSDAYQVAVHVAVLEYVRRHEVPVTRVSLQRGETILQRALRAAGCRPRTDDIGDVYLDAGIEQALDTIQYERPAEVSGPCPLPKWKGEEYGYSLDEIDPTSQALTYYNHIVSAVGDDAKTWMNGQVTAGMNADNWQQWVSDHLDEFLNSVGCTTDYVVEPSVGAWKSDAQQMLWAIGDVMFPVQSSPPSGDPGSMNPPNPPNVDSPVHCKGLSWSFRGGFSGPNCYLSVP